MNKQEQLEQAIAAQEGLRGTLNDAIVETTIAALRKQLRELEAAGRPGQQRKVATVLFMDVEDSTSMVRELDPEDSMTLLDTTLQRSAVAVEQNGGRVTRFMGDGIMAIFGHPVAHENDPTAAVQAGLAIQKSIKEFSKEVQTQFGLKHFRVRVGIDTGPVVIGGFTEAENTIMGSAAHLASRMESAAEPGTVLISHRTYQHIRGAFDLKPLEPVSPKGYEEPVPVYRVLGAKERSFKTRRRGVEGVETRMIGREDKIHALEEAFSSVAGERAGQIFTIVGEAGIGKSRLFFEFENWVDLQPEDVWLFKGRARLETQNIPYGLLRDLFAFRLTIQDDDPAADVRQKMEANFAEALGSGVESEMKAHFVGRLLGYDFADSPHLEPVLDDPRQLRHRGLTYLTEYFGVLAEQGPLLIMLDDIHWADGSTLDLLERLVPSIQERWILILCASRLALFERRPRWLDGKSIHTRLDLTPLSVNDSGQLVLEVLKKVPNVPYSVQELIVSNAEGNPLYLEELIKMLVEEGVIVKEEPQWRVQLEKLRQIQVPATLTDLLQARLDSLPMTERLLLQQASVVGRVFWDSLLIYLNWREKTGMTNAVVERGLGSLRDKEIVYRSELSSFAGVQEHAFNHVILREVTYESVLRAQRRFYHEQVAEWLISKSRGRLTEVAGMIAGHLEQSGNDSEALDYWHMAAIEAAAKYANEEAINYYNKALLLAPESDVETRWELLYSRERLNDRIGRRKEQLGDINSLESLAESIGDPRKQSQVALSKATYAAVAGDRGTAIAQAEAAVELARTGRATRLETEGHLYLGQTYWFLREYQASQTELETALNLARSGTFHQMEAESLRNLGIVAELTGEYGPSESYYEQALQIFREIGDQQGEGNTLNNYGLVASDQHNYDEAKNHYRQALKIFRNVGDSRGEAKVLSNLGIIYDDQGDYFEAKVHFTQALQIRLDIHDRQGESNSLYNLGFASRILGDYDGARDYFNRALPIFQEVGDRQGESLVLDGLGLIAHTLNDDVVAQDLSQQALQISEEIGDKAAQASALTTVGHTLVRLDQLETAGESYRQALDLRQSLGQDNLAMEPLSGLARISLGRGELAAAQKDVDDILNVLEQGNSLHGAREPIRIYLTCFKVLQANGDPRARRILRSSYDSLQKRAGRLPNDEARHIFLNNVPWHRELIEAHLEISGHQGPTIKG
jgi:class 3 adenylate cyclase/tetratricopeptide (TPR) repeat protein